MTASAKRRPVFRIGLRAMVALAMIAGVLAAVAAPRLAEAAVSCPDSAASEAAALVAAKQCGKRVEVLSSRTERSQVFANVSGRMTLESHVAPARVRGTDGSWSQLDTALRPTSDGGLAPVATLASVRFSGGDSGPLVSLSRNGHTFALSFPATLPPPVVEGDTAVYQNVASDVDLRVTATTAGFRTVLVVKTPSAAKSPIVRNLQLKLSGDTQVAALPGGGLEARAGGMRVVRVSPPAVWDSAAAPRPFGATDDERLAASARSAGSASRIGRAQLSVAGGDLVVTPDAAWLTDPGTTFPVFIDPDYGVEENKWAYSSSDDSNWDQVEENGTERQSKTGKDPASGRTSRSFLDFPTSSGSHTLAGKTVFSAKIYATADHTGACIGNPISLWSVAPIAGVVDPMGQIRQPHSTPLTARLTTSSADANESNTSGCKVVDDPFEFVSAELTNHVQAKATAGASVVPVALTSHNASGANESAQYSRVRMHLYAFLLSVDYNSNPNTPVTADLTAHSSFDATGVACVTGTGRPGVASLQPWLKAHLTDPDAADSGLLTATLEVNKQNRTTLAWEAFTTFGPNPVTDVVHGQQASTRVDSGLVDDDVMRWRVIQTTDARGGLTATASPWCELKVDNSPPGIPDVDPADGLYLEYPGNTTRRGSLGYSGQFILKANGQADVKDYVYKIDGGVQMVVAAPSLGANSPPVWVTPTHAGENVLTVRSRDSASNESAPYDYRFMVEVGSDPVGHWTMDEGSGATLTSTVSGGQSASLVNSPNWTDGRLVGPYQGVTDKSVAFNGTSQHAQTTTSVIDTSRSFTAAAWVKLNATNGVGQTLLGQAGDARSGFYLQYNGSRWAFVFASHDSDTPAAYYGAEDPTPAKAGVWTHVAGVYDVASGQIRLYVNGLLKHSAARPLAWNAAGKFQIGGVRNTLAGGMNYFAGSIAEARVWNRVVFGDEGSEIMQMAAPVKVGQWEMDDCDPFSTPPSETGDDSGYARPLLLGPTTQCGNGYNYSNALKFDASTGSSAATAGPVMRTDQSFTVAAWLFLTEATPYERSAVSQDGTSVSAFYLGTRDSTKWTIQLRATDSTACCPLAVAQGGTVTLNEWVHLVAVYDTHAAQLKLYVNGGLIQAVGVGAQLWNAAGPLRVGGGKWGGVYGDWMEGVDRVEAWQGVLTDAQIVAEHAEG